MKIKIKKSCMSEIDVLTNIDMQCFNSAYWNKETFKSELNSSYSDYLSAIDVESDKLLGYIGMWKVINEGHIVRLAVDPIYQRKHIADILLYNLILLSQKNKISYLTLEVESNNLKALSLYKKYMFNILGIRKKYYQDKQNDALVLWTGNINNKSFIDNARLIFMPYSDYLIGADKLSYIL